MVFHKRASFGFHGYQIPPKARGYRSARGRRLFRKNVEEDQMCAFELLATVAGKLLQENGTSKSPATKDFVKKERIEEDSDKNPLKIGIRDRRSSDGCSFALLKEYSQESSSSLILVKPTVLLERSCSEKEQKLMGSAELCDVKLENGIGTDYQVQIEKVGTGSAKTIGTEDPMDVDVKPSSLVSSDSSVEVPLYRNLMTCSSPIPKLGDDVELLCRDDDENSSGSTQTRTISSKTFGSQHNVDRRIKKVSASKFWKVGPTLLKDGDFYSHNADPKSMFPSRKMCCRRQRTQRSAFKMRKLLVRGSFSSGLMMNPEAISNYKTLEKGTSGDDRENGTRSCLPSKKSSHNSEDHKVKLRIKSFLVPELFVEMPEATTVGSLKRRVLETVTSMLENGFRVGVIVQGKKARDDNKTLAESGILSHEGKNIDNLGFTLEPNFSTDPEKISPQPLARIPPTSDSTLGGTMVQGDDLPLPPMTPPMNLQGRDHGSSSSSSHSSSRAIVAQPSPFPENPTPNTKALVPIQSSSDEVLTMVPLQRKSSKRSDLVQRRMRRPFSVAEVEALVQTVEDLGTGRWRDVKIRAFENAEHRTYVDLKDKWKTLVHTARISPQQRRGEPVPQELLDRVLRAHAHWSNHQTKLQTKQLQLTMEQTDCCFY